MIIFACQTNYDVRRQCFLCTFTKKKKNKNFSGFVVKKPRMVFTLYMAVKRVSMGLTDRRKADKNLFDSRKN